MLSLLLANNVDPFAEVERRLRQQADSALVTAQAKVFEKLAPISDYLAAVPDWVVGLMAMALLMVPIVAWRLSKLSKPEAPLLSTFLNYLGRAVLLASVTAAVATSVLVAIFVGAHYFIGQQAFLASAFQTHAWMAFYCGVLGVVAALVLVFRDIPRWERGSGLPDVREAAGSCDRYISFEPARVVRLSKGCLVGKDKRGKPIYLPWPKLRETHVQVIGTTGCGKGTLLAVVAYQCVLMGEAVWWFDPKNDRYSCRLMQQAAEEADRPFILLNLNADQPPQFNLLAGASAHEISDLFVAGFDLRGKGTDGDFHRGRDEDAAMQAAELAVSRNLRSLGGVMAACSDKDAIVKHEHFWRCLRKVAQLPACQTKTGADLPSAIADGAVVYVIGSADSEVVKMLQRMVLVRLVQLIKARDRDEELRPVCVVLDEFKHLISPVSLAALGTVRDFGAHFLLAHQSLGDLESCPGISPADAYGAVVDNTAIKFVFRINDGEHAERLARAAGMRRTFSEVTSKEAGEFAGAGAWRETQTHYLNPDLLTHLPMPSDRPRQASVGVLFGFGMARLFYLGPLAVTGAMPRPVEAPRFAGAAMRVDGAPGLI